MTSVLVDDNPQDVPTDARTDTGAGAGPHDRGLRRFVAAVVIGMARSPSPTSGSSGTCGRPDRPVPVAEPENFYDLQAQAMLDGHLYVPNGSLGIEAFVHGGRQYTYFGLFPSLIRLPRAGLHPCYDGRLTSLSLLHRLVRHGGLRSLLLWRVRVVVRGRGARERGGRGLRGYRGALTGGSVLVYLASSPTSPSEDWPGASP